MQPTNKLPEDSLRRRYAVTIGVRLYDFALSLLTAGVTPRALGPIAYGNYEFLTNYFTQMVNFLDLGASSCFYAKLSQRHDDQGLVRFYWAFSALTTVLIAGAILFAFMVGWAPAIWPDQKAKYILLAFILGALTYYQNTINRMVDAYGLTVRAEWARVYQRTFGVILLLSMYWKGYFSLLEFFFINTSWSFFWKARGFAF